ncbi:hypothetical protein ASPSYDRAFT_30048 [Aspergillus sydowii CBS 593.65]|uniref:Uncharacterized protein n=1 Tax=Aspergillus sydowii CBS 593.65 TaxID=1036612 RepID=A0A1L9TQ54_9EURO|nr:uncharacterized protein ASPSYDRAFT_30048 [Aspergillus sydowii CBS 593.65]OJJ61564.1 hypothetical protein ASPSYDRAFT_30048 [Aspergillus sydowii CBS 593.65]
MPWSMVPFISRNVCCAILIFPYVTVLGTTMSALMPKPLFPHVDKTSLFRFTTLHTTWRTFQPPELWYPFQFQPPQTNNGRALQAEDNEAFRERLPRSSFLPSRCRCTFDAWPYQHVHVACDRSMSSGVVLPATEMEGAPCVHGIDSSNGRFEEHSVRKALAMR